jgi:hypothetical protein
MQRASFEESPQTAAGVFAGDASPYPATNTALLHGVDVTEKACQSVEK